MIVFFGVNSWCKRVSYTCKRWIRTMFKCIDSWFKSKCGRSVSSEEMKVIVSRVCQLMEQSWMMIYGGELEIGDIIWVNRRLLKRCFLSEREDADVMVVCNWILVVFDDVCVCERKSVVKENLKLLGPYLHTGRCLLVERKRNKSLNNICP